MIPYYLGLVITVRSSGIDKTQA